MRLRARAFTNYKERAHSRRRVSRKRETTKSPRYSSAPSKVFCCAEWRYGKSDLAKVQQAVKEERGKHESEKIRKKMETLSRPDTGLAKAMTAAHREATQSASKLGVIEKETVAAPSKSAHQLRQAGAHEPHEFAGDVKKGERKLKKQTFQSVWDAEGKYQIFKFARGPRVSIALQHRIPDPLPADISDVCDKTVLSVWYCICVW